jgi:hypothetical protein
MLTLYQEQRLLNNKVYYLLAFEALADKRQIIPLPSPLVNLVLSYVLDVADVNTEGVNIATVLGLQHLRHLRFLNSLKLE